MRNIYTEKNVIEKLKKHELLYSKIQYLYRTYCNLIGPSHVLPNFLVIGTKKSGTTSIYRYLIQHPLVINAATKETGFFDRYFHKGVNWYRMNFPSKKTMDKGNLITGEATPTYIYHPHAPKRVHDLLPNVKLIVLLRNPIDRAYSHYTLEAITHNNETLSFEEAIEQEPSRLEGEFEKMEKDENYYSVNYYLHSYLTSSIYADQLERWFKYFPREQFLIMNADELNTSVENIYLQTLKFLNLYRFPLQKYENIKKRNYQKMNPETRKKLAEFFKPHNERLYKLLGTNFHWD